MKCKICNEEFTPKAYNARYCKDECRKTAKSDTHKQWYENNKARVKLYDAQYYKDNADHLKQYSNRYRQQRMKTDINYKLRHNLRKRLCKAISIGQKAGSAVRDLGCSIDELKEYLESKFQEGMSWSDWGRGKGKWHIDHIIPLKHFDLTDREQFLKANHYTNLQPLWEQDNLTKGDNTETNRKQ